MWIKLISVLLGSGLALSASLSEAKVSEYRLENGLRLIVKEDHRAPVVVSQVWYKVGSSYEWGGITGISHALEHMMFRGTEQHPPGEFSRIIAANGGSENAFTGRDHTAYFQQLEAGRLAISFELEADRMRGLKLDKQEFANERNVIMEERRLRTEDRPQALTYEQFTETAFSVSPYRQPAIGWMDDISHLSVEDLQDWYQTWYAPNNAIVVVVGDVDPEAVYRLAKKYFGVLEPSSSIPALKPRREPEQSGLRRITVKAPGTLPYLVMGYKVPVVKTTEHAWEPYALQVLEAILDGGDSARFARYLVREAKVATAAGARYSPYSRMQDLFLIDAVPAQGQNVQAVEAALREQIVRLQKSPPEASELRRVKAQVVASKVYEKDSVFYQAMEIGTLETVGLNWRLAESYVERIRAVTAEQVQQVAQKYLTDDRLTVAVFEPQSVNGTPSPPSRLTQDTLIN